MGRVLATIEANHKEAGILIEASFVSRNRAMKILLLNDRIDPTGGSQLMTLALRDGLRGRGHEARVLASRVGLQSRTRKEATISVASGEARTLSGGRSSDCADYICYGSLATMQTLNRTINPSATAVLAKALREFDPDIVHVRAFLTQLSPAILPLLRHRRSLFHAVMYDAVCPTGKKLLPDGTVCRNRAGWVCRQQCLSPQAFAALMTQRWLFRRWRDVFDSVVANSAATAAKLEAEEIGPVQVVWNAVPDTVPRPGVEHPPTAVIVGRLSQEKGVAVAVRAFSEVHKRLPAARLIIIGDGPQRDEIERLITSLNLNSAVELVGRLSRNEMQERARACWVQLVPSVWDEPFGLVAAEAMMRGTAVIASASGGLAEIVKDGETGFLTTPGDSTELAAAIKKILTDKSRAQVMGTAARTHARKHFTLNHMLDQFEDIYHALLIK